MDANSQSGKLNNAITEQRIETAQSSGVPVNTGPNLMDGTTAFIRQTPSTQMPNDDDVYEFKSSPEDNAMLLNPTGNFGATAFEKSRHGLDQEADQDEGNLIVDEQMEVDEYGQGGESKRHSGQRPLVPTFEIERCDDEELEETESNDGQQMDERRKVPPLRILLNKNGDGDSKNLSPSLSASALDNQSGTPSRKRGAKKQTAGASGTSANDKRLTRFTRGQLAKQTVPLSEGLGSSAKRPRAVRRNIGTSGPSSRALTPKREREVSQAPSTSSAVQADQTGVSMPPSPDANSRSSGASDNDPLFHLQPEKLSFEVTNLFSHCDLGAYVGLKKMITQRWARDFQGQQTQTWKPVHCKSSLNRSTWSKPTKLVVPQVPRVKSNATSLELLRNQIVRQQHLRKKQYKERHRLAQFVEREFKRQLNDISIRSKTAVTCMRVLSDSDVYNGNILDANVDDVGKIQPRSRDEVIGFVRERVEPLVNDMLKRHQIESDSLYYEQCAEWERYVADKVSMDQHVGKFEDFTLRHCAKHVKTKSVNLDRILR